MLPMYQLIGRTLYNNSTLHLQKNVVPKQDVLKLITRKEQILSYYADVFEGNGRFPGPHYHIQLDLSVTPKQTH